MEDDTTLRPSENSSASRQKTEALYQGDFVVSGDPDVVLVTILGSCVSTFFHDPVARVGGANHFLVATGMGNAENSLRFGVHAMELLINELLKMGARRERLVAKVFGGARMFDDLVDIGQQNAEFALQFLKDENISCVSQSVLGRQARKVRYWPASGRAQQFLVASRGAPRAEEPVVPASPAVESTVTLF